MINGVIPSRAKNMALAAPAGPPPTIRTSVFIVDTLNLPLITFPDNRLCVIEKAFDGKTLAFGRVFSARAQ